MENLAIGLGLLLFFATLWDHFRLRRSLLEQRAAARGFGIAGADGRKGKPLPSITVVRPVRGLDVDAAKNLAAALDNDVSNGRDGSRRELHALRGTIIRQTADIDGRAI